MKTAANPRGRMYGGLIIIAIGALLLARKAGVEFPAFLLSWEMLLIAIGAFIGFRHQFRGIAWIILIAVGGLFLTDHYLIEDFDFGKYIWPLVIIAIGVSMIWRPRREKSSQDFFSPSPDTPITSGEDRMDAVAIMGGIKKNIISKNFRGGEGTAVMGGLEIDLSKADIVDTAVLEVTNIMGGTVINIPANWKLRTDEVVCILGGLEDKRIIHAESEQATKTLVLKGTCILGGIEIKNY